MADELTFSFPHEMSLPLDGKHYFVGLVDTEITVSVDDDGSFAIDDIKVEGAHGWSKNRVVHLFSVGPEYPLYAEIKQAASVRAVSEIDDARSQGKIGPAARRENALLDAGKERAKAARLAAE